LARKILLADDSVTAQNMGRKILTDAGYDVITVNNGSAALKRVAELKPDLIVLDVYMPGYSGLEVCVRLKEAPETARIPILLTVGKLEPFKPGEATRVRADGFIIKPFEASELLSALTRLEDRVVPSSADGSRFSTSVSGLERFSGDQGSKRSEGSDGSDTGWKNRLRIPSKKKKEEAEPEPEPDFVTPSSFRDFRRGVGKAPAGSSPFPLNATASAAQEPGLVPDIPRDITPDELDALSELVAKLDGVPAAEHVAPISEKIGPVTVPSETPATDSVPEVQVSETKIEADAVAPAAEIQEKSEIVPSGADAIAIKTDAVEAPLTTSAVEIPAVESAPTEAAVPDAVAHQTETAVAQEPAPIDRGDEPRFASAATQDIPGAEKTEALVAQAPVVDPPAAESPVAESQALESKSEIAAEESKVEETQKVDEAPLSATGADRSQQAAAAEGSSPSAEELAEALRFLTPSQSPDASQTLAEAGAALANELSHGTGNGNRWIAEVVALSPEEESGSLEAEMFRTFGPSAVDQTGSHNALPVAASASEPGVAATEAMAAIIAAAQENTALAVAMVASASPLEQTGTEQEGLSAKPVEEAPEEQAAAMTFADAVQSAETESVSASAENSGNTAAEAQREAVSSLENGPGGEEVMDKEAKGKSGKSNWHQIRSGAPSATTNALEAAKQAEEPKSMAAAASADSATASSIASIVDSVLADLRPKIVEEIAKQLAKK
jgi:CheY-like chemotaxis protein